MAAKKYSSTELKNDKGKPIDTRGIEGAGETVTLKEGDKDVVVKITDAITDFVVAAEQEKIFKEKKEKVAEVLRMFMADVRGFFADRKDFTKTFRIFGNKTDSINYAVEVSSTDKCSPPTKKEDLAALKKLLTAGVFNQLFEEVTVISIKKTISDDDKKRRELTKLLIDALGEEKVKEYFEKDTTFVVKVPKDMSLVEKVFGFNKDQQKIIRENLKFASDAVKDASSVNA